MNKLKETKIEPVTPMGARTARNNAERAKIESRREAMVDHVNAIVTTESPNFFDTRDHKVGRDAWQVDFQKFSARLNHAITKEDVDEVFARFQRLGWEGRVHNGGVCLILWEPAS